MDNLSATLPRLDVNLNGIVYVLAPTPNGSGIAGSGLILSGPGIPPNSLCAAGGLGYINTRW